MLHRYSALAIAASIAASAVFGAVSLPQAAEAQVYDDGGPRPFAMRTHDDMEFDQGHARFDHRQAVDYSPVGPVPYPHHRPAGYDDRFGEPSPYGRHARGGDRPPFGDDEPHWDRGDGRPGPDARFDGPGFPDRAYGIGPVEEIAAPVAPLVYEGRRGPDVGCTIERSESTTAVGWRKIVTHKTCYQR